ncbi:hypothetical protein HAX54_041032, partial [Datura stramonium]|nr:hypothetical protein [Datura stramonium]
MPSLFFLGFELGFAASVPRRIGFGICHAWTTLASYTPACAIWHSVSTPLGAQVVLCGARAITH